MERRVSPRRRRRADGGAERWLRLLRDTGIALVGMAALAGLARDLSATRGPVVAWIIVTLLGGAAGLFAWSLLELRDVDRRTFASRASREAAELLTADALDALDPHRSVPMMPFGLFPPASRSTPTTVRATRRHPPTGRASREQRMRTRRTPAACAATTRAHRHAAHAPRRLPPANI